MKSIGVFAKENKVTIKALHHYEKLGLLLPAKVDPESKYRYYDISQQHDLEMIILLKDLGFSLSEIKEIFTTNNLNTFTNLLSSKQQQTQIDISSANRRYNKLTAILKVIQTKAHSNLNYKELISMSENNNTQSFGNAKFHQLANSMLEQATNNNSRIAVLQMDIDEFINVNKNYGREVGDIVIDRIANTILTVITKYNQESIFERKGGDEYTVVINAPIEEGITLGKEILKHINNIDYLDIADDLQPTITIGIQESNQEINSIHYLIHEATTVLYEAKRNGNKNSVNY